MAKARHVRGWAAATSRTSYLDPALPHYFCHTAFATLHTAHFWLTLLLPHYCTLHTFDSHCFFHTAHCTLLTHTTFATLLHTFDSHYFFHATTHFWLTLLHFCTLLTRTTALLHQRAGYCMRACENPPAFLSANCLQLSKWRGGKSAGAIRCGGKCDQNVLGKILCQRCALQRFGFFSGLLHWGYWPKTVRAGEWGIV